MVAQPFFSTTRDAFSLPARNLTESDRARFLFGNSFFNKNWVTAPASTTGRDGLGPLFNSMSCSGCHFKDGRSRPPDFNGNSAGLLVRLSMPNTDTDGVPGPEPTYGDQLQTQAVSDVEAEGSVKISYEEVKGYYKDGSPYSLAKPKYELVDLRYGPMQENIMISPRVAPGTYGMGLLEAISEETILSRSDPTDMDGDGISGRPNYVWDYSEDKIKLGRFWLEGKPAKHPPTSHCGVYWGYWNYFESLSQAKSFKRAS